MVLHGFMCMHELTATLQNALKDKGVDKSGDFSLKLICRGKLRLVPNFHGHPSLKNIKAY